METSLRAIASLRSRCLLTLLLVVAASSAAKAESQYRLMSRNSNLALDVIGLSTSDGGLLQQWPYWSGNNQRWFLRATDNGAYTVVNVNSGKCLDVSGISLVPGAAVWQWDCVGGANQKWAFVPVDDGAFELVSANSGLALDVIGVSTAAGAKLQQWSYWGGDNQQWFVQEVDGGSGAPTGVTGPPSTTSSSSSPTPANPSTPSPGPTVTPPRRGNFGNATLHPEKIGFYMVPDLENPYIANGGSLGGWCPWTTTQASLFKLHTLMPDTIVRWDNETGHNTDSTSNVETFISCAQNAGVKMIIAGSAVDGYNNFWANGSNTPNASLIDFANGPYLTFAHDMLTRYPVVQLVETANEPDGPWFNNDGDNASHFDYYMSRLTSAMGSDSSRIVGPSAAIIGSNIWNYFNGRGDMQNISYHTYSAAASLFDVPNKQVYVTEYGGYNLDPGAILADLWHAEHDGKLNGSIRSLFYVQLTDNGGNRGAFNERAMEGNHFALRDWFRALTLHQALTQVAGTAVYFDNNNADFMATDNGNGGFGALAWNNTGGNLSGDRQIPGTSLGNVAQLYVVRVNQGDANVAQCSRIGDQNWVSVQQNNGTTTLSLQNIPAHAAVFVSTAACDGLAD